MNMNIKLNISKIIKKFHYLIGLIKKLDNYMLPSFTKKIVEYLEKINEKSCNYWSRNIRTIYCQFI